MPFGFGRNKSVGDASRGGYGPCPLCNPGTNDGRGYWNDFTQDYSSVGACQDCGGLGGSLGNDDKSLDYVCSTCRGTGSCQECHGSGVVWSLIFVEDDDETLRTNDEDDPPDHFNDPYYHGEL